MKNILTGRMRKVFIYRRMYQVVFCGARFVIPQRRVGFCRAVTPAKSGSVPLYNRTKSIIVTGVVTSEGGEPIIGATVQVKGTSTGVITDIDGRYTITVPDGNSILSVSFIGYQSQEIKVNSRRGINVCLQENVQSLDEVMVVAYGVQKKATLTGAISSVGTEALLKSPSASVTNSLAGQLPGVFPCRQGTTGS